MKRNTHASRKDWRRRPGGGKQSAIIIMLSTKSLNAFVYRSLGYYSHLHICIPLRHRISRILWGCMAIPLEPCTATSARLDATPHALGRHNSCRPVIIKPTLYILLHPRLRSHSLPAARCTSNTTTVIMSSETSYKYFNVTIPSEYVAHVEINRPDKLNAFHTE